MTFRLIEISEEGAAILPGGDIADIAIEICFAYAGIYRRVGFVRPWVGYLALDGTSIVGTCSFKSVPIDGRVDIAFFTFADFEGRGYATRMVAALGAIANDADPIINLVAHTLPKENASTTILEKNGFVYQGMINHPDDGLVWEWVFNMGPPSPTGRG